MNNETSVNDELIFTENLTSWARLKMLAQLYWPGLRPGVVGFAVFPMLMIVVCGLIYPVYHDVFELAVSVPLTFAIYAAPTLICSRDYRHVSHQLPVTAGEKLGFLLITFWIVMPAIILLSANVGEWLCGIIYGDDVNSALRALEIAQAKGFSKGMGCVFLVSVITVVLYYLVTARGNRLRAGLIGFCVTMVALMLIVGFAGFLVGVYQGYQNALGKPQAAFTPEQLTTMLMVGATALVALVGAVYVVKLYKHLRNHGF